MRTLLYGGIACHAINQTLHKNTPPTHTYPLIPCLFSRFQCTKWQRIISNLQTVPNHAD